MFVDPAIRQHRRHNGRAAMAPPSYGRFLEPDPIGYGDGPNWYAYTHNDPVNDTDPSGLAGGAMDPIYVTAMQNAAIEAALAGGAIFTLQNSITGDGGRGGCRGDCRPIVITKRRPRFLIVHYVPWSALTCTSLSGWKFYAPRNFSLNKIVAAGRSGGQNPFATSRAVGYYGTFDFQRVRDAQGHTTFYSAYTNASNYAAGAYEYGSGTPYPVAMATLKTFSALFSSNSGSNAQETYFREGYMDAQFDSVKCSAQ